MDLNKVDRSGAPAASSLVPLGEAIGSAAAGLQTKVDDSITSLNRASSALNSDALAIPHEIVFIDKGIADYQALAAGINPNTEVVLLDAQQDGIAQITNFLAQRTGISALHIVSHGNAADLQLGSTHLNWGTLQSYEGSLKSWAKSFTTGADILLYGCDVAAGGLGMGFVQSLGLLTGADIAASNNLTGDAAQGGDWSLEVNTGAIAAHLAFQASVLATYHSVFVTPISDSQYATIKTGYNKVLDTFQSGIDTLVLANNLPLVGDKLKDTAKFFQGVKNQAAIAFTTLDGIASKTAEQIQAELNTALGSLLPVPIALSVTDLNNAVDSDGDGTLTNDADQIQFNMNLLQTGLTSAAPIGFDLGIPALKLNVNGSVDAKLNYSLPFNVGFNTLTNDFYFDTSALNELQIALNVATPGLNATGSLGFLQLNVQDSATNPTAFTGAFSVDLRDPNSDGKLTLTELNTAGLSLTQVMSPKLDADAAVNLLLTTSFGGSSVFPSLQTDFNLAWSFNPTDTNLSGGLPTAAFNNVRLNLGSFFSDFVAPIAAEVKQVLDPIQPVLDVLNTRMPVLSDIEFLRNRYDAVANGGNGDGKVSLVEFIGKESGNTQAVQFINAVSQFKQFIDAIPTGVGSVYIPLGNLRLNETPGTDLRSLADLSSLGITSFDDLTASLPGVDAGTLTILQNFRNQASNAQLGGGLAFPILQNPTTAFGLLLGRDVSLFTFDLPTLGVDFNVSQFFPILGPLGVRLAGAFSASADFAFGYDTFGIREFSTALTDGDPATTANASMLFDGFFVSDTDRADGTFGADVPEIRLNASITASGELNVIVAAAGVGGGIFANVNFDLLNPSNPTNDPTKDGKVRLSELASEVSAHGPLGIFKTSGKLEAGLEAYVKVGVDLPFVGFVGWEDSFDIARVTLLNFDFDPSDLSPAPVLAQFDASLGAGTLRLNMGQFASARLSGNITDGDETFQVTRSDDGTKILVTAFGFTQEFDASAVQKIYAEGGIGNDTITIAENVVVPAELWGDFKDPARTEFGNDKLFAGGAAAQLYGGGGDDQLTARAGDSLLIGGAGDDKLFGGTGNDTLDGGAGSDRLYGNAGNDSLDGGSENDYLDAGDGNDTVNGGTGDDRIKGGAGDDILNGNDGNDIIEAGTGNDVADGGAGNDYILDEGTIVVGTTGGSSAPVPPGGAELQNVTITPTAGVTVQVQLGVGGGNDRFFGGTGNDVIFGQAGNDILIGQDGNDYIDGGSGNDIIAGDLATIDGTGAVTLIAGVGGNDLLFGGSGNDTLYGQGGNDTLSGQGDNDTLFGNEGNDILSGGAGDDVLSGNQGNDVLFGEEGQRVDLGGGAVRYESINLSLTGNDIINGNEDNDIAIGGNGNDQILGNVGADIALIGDNGRVTLNSSGVYTRIEAFGTTGGNDTITGSVNSDIILGGMGSDTLLDGGGTAADILLGDNGIIFGADGSADANDILSTDTNAGDRDDIHGGGGNDIIIGGAGNDNRVSSFGGLFGDAGDDIIIGDNARITRDAANVIQKIETIAPADGGDDLLEDSNGNSILIGGVGNDTITAGAGADTLIGDNGEITFNGAQVLRILTKDAANGGNDTITGGDSADIILGGTGNDSISGGSDNAADILLGDNGVVVGADGTAQANDIFSTDPDFGGRDTITGGGGKDIILGGSGGLDVAGSVGDNLSGGSDDDIMLGDGGYITRNAANTIEKIETLFSNKGGDDTIDGGTGITIALGGFGSDTIMADTGADILLGDNGVVDYSADGNLATLDFVTATSTFGGNDTITGNSGNDIILGGAGNDSLAGDAGQDTILGDNGKVTLQANVITRIETTDAATSSGNDTIIGGNDADTILGGSGNDSIAGGDDNAVDILLGDNGVVVGADGSADANDIFSTDPDFGGKDTITGGGGNDIILGGSGGGDVAGSPGDSLFGNAGDDIILGDGGYITRNASNAIEKIETLFPNKGGDDTIDGGTGMTIALGGFGNDTITADTGADILLGDNGVVDYSADGNLATLDFITAASEFGGNDTITGNSGNDIIIGGAANDNLAGDAGQDTILGDNGKVTLQANVITRIETTDAATSSGNDTITGGNDADIVLGGSGNDSISGGSDNADDILLGDNGVVVRADGSSQANDIFSTDPDFGGTDTITGGGGNDIIIGGSGGSDTTGMGGDNLAGNDGNDVVIGDNATVTRNAADVIEKIATTFPNQGGDDTIAGNAGDDRLIGGFGNDAIAGSTGNDIILGDNGLLDYTVDGNLATLDLITTTDPGLGGSDTITGDDGDDIALGGFAGDTIAGNAGNDILLGDNGQIVFSGTQITRIETIDPSFGGNDVIQGNEGTDRILGGFGNDTFKGNEGDDIILGDNGLLNYGIDGNLTTLDLIITTDTITATGGADAIEGNDGNDIILGGVAGDTILGDSGNGKGSNPGADTLLGDNGQITLIGGVVSLIETITPGLGGNDTISGNEDDDLIAGGFGDDTLYGDAGADRILGDNGKFDYNYGEAGVVANDNNLATLDFFTTTNPTLGGNDLIFGGFGNDTVMGGTGADTIYGDNGVDVLDGNWFVAGMADFTGDGKPDIFWRNRETGQNLVWQMNGSSAIAAVPVLTVSPDWTLAGTADFNKDGQTDLLWRNQITGENAIWTMTGTTYNTGIFLPTVDVSWQIKGTADFNKDGQMDLLWRNQATGENAIWTLNGTAYSNGIYLPQVVDRNWDIKGTADFNKDGQMDLLWRNQVTGENAIWTLNGTVYNNGIYLPTVTDANWQIKGIANFDNDANGYADLLWRNQATGENAVWTLTGTAYNNGIYLPTVTDLNWNLAGTADFNGDGRGDLLWHQPIGATAIWQVNGLNPNQINSIGLGDRPTVTVSGSQWTIDGKADFDKDGQVDLLWRNQVTGETAIWLLRGTQLKQEVLLPTVDVNWQVNGIADFDHDANGYVDLLWRNKTTGENAIWTLNGATYKNGIFLTPVSDTNWQIKGVADFDHDVNGFMDLLWRNKATGENAIWTLNGTTYQNGIFLTPVSDGNWDIKGIADFNHDNNADLLWRNKATGENAIWTLNGTTYQNGIFLTPVGDGNWDIKGIADFNHDNNADLLWRNQATGENAVWTLNSTAVANSVFLTPVSDLNWEIKGTAAFNADSDPDLLWYNRATGQSVSWLMNNTSLALGVYLQNGTEANDLLLGDHGKVYTALPAGQNYFSIDTQATDGGGNDLIFGNQGDDTILGQQGDDRLFGDTGEDDIIGGHNVVGGADGNDTIDGGANADVVLGDNGTITRRSLGYNLWQRYPQPFADVIRDVVRFDDRDRIGGNDTIYGGSGDDILHAQRGNDLVFGNAGDDEIYGELGNDTISGGTGQDTALGDVGIITRAYNADGTPRLNPNGSWHRDVILTDVGKLTGTVSPSALTGDLFQTTDRFLLTATSNAGGTDAAVQLITLYDDGNDIINGDAGDDSLFGQRGNDIINGGSGNDFLQGNAGDDQMNGDAGDDVVIGDDGNTVAAFNTQLPSVVQGIHLIDKNAGIDIDLGTYGTVVLPNVTIEPQMTYGLLPTLALVPQLPRDASPIPTIGALKTTNGTVLQPLASIVPDLVHHLDLLAGNDFLNGGAGNDKIVGDNDSAFMPLRTGNAAFDLTLDQTTRRLYQLVYDLHDLELAYASTSGATAQTLRLGNDTIGGDDGNDTVYGDNNTLFGPVVTQMPGNAGALSNLLGNLNQAIARFSGGINNLLAPFAGGISSQPYTLAMGNDTINGGNGDDKLFADDSLQIAPLVTSLPYQRGSFWQPSLTIGLDRPGRNNFRDFNLTLGNDTVSGDSDNDLIEGDYSTVITPIITQTTPLSNQQRESLNVLVKDINDFVRDRYQDKHGIDYNNRNRDNTLIAQNDRLLGNAGDDLLLGDNATFIIPFLNGQVNLSMNLDGSILDYLDTSDEAHNFFQGLPHQYDTLFRNLGAGYTQLAQDTISGGDGNDILFGLRDRDSLYGDALPGDVSTSPGNDYLFGGQETDTLIGGGGSDIVRSTNPSPSDEVAIAPTVNARIIDLLSPATRQYLLDSLKSKDTLALIGELYIDLPG